MQYVDWVTWIGTKKFFSVWCPSFHVRLMSIICNMRICKIHSLLHNSMIGTDQVDIVLWNFDTPKMTEPNATYIKWTLRIIILNYQSWCQSHVRDNQIKKPMDIKWLYMNSSSHASVIIFFSNATAGRTFCKRSICNCDHNIWGITTRILVTVWGIVTSLPHTGCCICFR